MRNRRFSLSSASRLCAPLALALSCLGGCLQPASNRRQARTRRTPTTPFALPICSPVFRRRRKTQTPAGRSPRQCYYGAPVEALVRPSAEHDGPPADGAGGFTLNFENTPVATVAKVVLGDILNVGYAIDPRAQGTISLSSGRPVAKRDMLFVLENALRANNLVLVRDAVGFRILPATDGAVGSVDRPGANGGAEPGYGLTVIPLEYVSGETLVKLLEGFESKPGTIRSDPSGKILLVLGTGTERQAALDTVRDFDVDWLRGQSVGIYPVHNGAPATMVTELEKIMDSGETGLSHNLVKFQAIERQNSILVVASKPGLLRMASTWISRLDRSSVASTGVKVYRVKYGDAQTDVGAGEQYFHRRVLRRPRVAVQPDRAQSRDDDAQPDRPADGRGSKAGNAACQRAARPGAGRRSRSRHLHRRNPWLSRRRGRAAASRRPHHGRRRQQFGRGLRQRGELPHHRARPDPARPAAAASRHRRHHRRDHAQ